MDKIKNHLPFLLLLIVAAAVIILLAALQDVPPVSKRGRAPTLGHPGAGGTGRRPTRWRRCS